MMQLLFGVLLLGQLPTIQAADFPKEVQERAIQATVRIANAAQNVQGTGVILGQQKPFVYILTANHVVEGADGLEVQTFSTRSYPKSAAVYRSAEVLAQAKKEDLALLRLATVDQVPGRIHPCPQGKAPRMGGFTALTVGCTGGRPPSCRLEKVTGNKRVRRPDAVAIQAWETDTGPEQGRSGGPLLDRQLQLLGIASGQSEARGYFTHVEEVYRFLRRHGLGWLAEPQKPD